MEARDELETCVRGKQTQTPFPKSESQRSSKLLEIIHADVCGPMKVASKGGAKYFAVFVDDSGVVEDSRWCETVILSKKSDVLEAFKKFKAAAENVTGEKVKKIYNLTMVVNL